MSETEDSGTERLLVQTQDKGLTQGEIDDLSLKIEQLLERGEDPVEVVEWILEELPDSEHGCGEFSPRSIDETPPGRTRWC